LQEVNEALAFVSPTGSKAVLQPEIKLKNAYDFKPEAEEPQPLTGGELLFKPLNISVDHYFAD
jgi:hypothetical protein